MMERKFFIIHFLKPMLMATDPNIADVRYTAGVNGELLIIEHKSLNSKIVIEVTGADCKTIIRRAIKHI